MKPMRPVVVRVFYDVTESRGCAGCLSGESLVWVLHVIAPAGVCRIDARGLMLILRNHAGGSRSPRPESTTEFTAAREGGNPRHITVGSTATEPTGEAGGGAELA